MCHWQRYWRFWIRQSDKPTNAIRYCIAHDVMGEFLSQNGSEVENMLFTEWNMEEALAVTAEEALAEGRAQGVAEGMARGTATALERVIRALDGVLSPEVIAERLDLPLAEVLAVLEKANR